MFRRCIFSLFVMLFSDVFALERGDCSPVISGNVSKSKIILNCSKELPLGAKYKLEALLNEKISGDDENECSPEFKGTIKSSDIDIRCGYPIEDIQKLIDDFLIKFKGLKIKLADLNVTDADTELLQEEANRAVDLGEFDRAQKLIDQIIAAEEALGLKVLEQIKELRGVFKDAQKNTAEAGIAAGEVMIEQMECDKAMEYFELADESINSLNANSLKPLAELPVDKVALRKLLKKCQSERRESVESLVEKSENWIMQLMRKLAW